MWKPTLEQNSSKELSILTVITSSPFFFPWSSAVELGPLTLKLLLTQATNDLHLAIWNVYLIYTSRQFCSFLNWPLLALEELTHATWKRRAHLASRPPAFLVVLLHCLAFSVSFSSLLPLRVRITPSHPQPPLSTHPHLVLGSKQELLSFVHTHSLDDLI